MFQRRPKDPTPREKKALRTIMAAAAEWYGTEGPWHPEADWDATHWTFAMSLEINGTKAELSSIRLPRSFAEAFLDLDNPVGMARGLWHKLETEARDHLEELFPPIVLPEDR